MHRIAGIFLSLIGVAGLATSKIYESLPAQYETLGFAVSSGLYWLLMTVWIIALIAGAALVMWDAYLHFKN